MVVVNARTNIFNLINNKDSSVDDFKRLYAIAPEKFILIKKDYPQNNIIQDAAAINRTDLVDYFKTLALPISYNSMNPVEVIKKLKQIIRNDQTIVSELNDIKHTIKDVDLSKYDILQQKDIVNTIILKAGRTLKVKNDILFALIDNPKGGIDINLKYSNHEPLFFSLFQAISSERAKYILDKYKPDIKLKYNELSLLLYLIQDQSTDSSLAITEKYYVIKNVLEYSLRNGMNINDKHSYLRIVYKFAQKELKERLYKLFIENGVNIDETIFDELTLLMICISDKNKALLDYLLEKGANVNYKTSTYKIAPLANAIMINDIYYIKALIDKGVDVNMPMGRNDISPLQFAVKEKNHIEIIKLLLDSGVNKDYKAPIHNITALDMAIESYETDKEYYGEVIKLLRGKIPEEAKWKGFSRSDIEKFDIFFEKPFDWSCCPVCLEYVERSDGCMYMSHDCATTKHFYHKKLYDKFVYGEYGSPRIEWCTVCGRITELHKHYKLSSAQTPVKEVAPLKPEIQALLDRGDNVAFFDNANCLGFGGGGTEEKAARFRRMREYALELQDDVDKKKLNEAMEELIEEVWNAPLVRNKKIKKILEDKRWNINVKEFPENKKNTRNNNNNTNAVNVPFEGVKPTIVEDDCIIMGEDEATNTLETNPKYHFHHETIGGIDHEGIYICQKDLAKAIEIKNAEFGLENFGKCWWHYTCKANLHPEELKGIIPEVLYEEYRKKFNKKMKQKGGTRKLKKKIVGGNVKSMLYELEDGTCTPHNHE
jgi:ankyrin repeat protein